VRRPALATLALSMLALLFGWETRQALLATPGGQDNAVSATAGIWKPGVPTPDPHPPRDPMPTAAAVVARPLFRPDRQPFREDASKVPARNYETELSRFMLLGVLGFGEEPVGVVTAKTGNKTDRWELKAGDALPGFKVKEVGMEGLRLTSDGREFLLPLYAGPPTAAAGAVRTEVPRRDAAPPAAAPGSPASAKPAAPGSPASAKPAAPGAPPRPGTLTAPAPAQPMPAFNPSDRSQRSYRYAPGRR
jgi:hypothetical protein